MLKQGGILEVREEEPQETEERQRKPTLLYKKQIRATLPTNVRAGKNVYVVLNNEFNDQLETVLKLAWKEAQNRNKKTISGNDIKNAIISYKKTGAVYILENIETVILGKIKEIKEATKGRD